MYISDDIPSNLLRKVTAELHARAGQIVAFQPAGFTGTAVITDVDLGSSATAPLGATLLLWPPDTVPGPATPPAAAVSSVMGRPDAVRDQIADVRRALRGPNSQTTIDGDIAVAAEAHGATLHLRTTRSATGELFSEGRDGEVYVAVRQDPELLRITTLEPLADPTEAIDAWATLVTGPLD
jgi:hypothetical protein